MSSGSVTRMLAPDADVRELVVQRVHESFIVQAPAGSGKTELLAQRFLSLLVTVEHPESVLAITFTRKAASEMRIRVLQALDSAREAMDTSQLEAMDPHKRQRRELALAVLAWDQKHEWKLLENPMRLQIRTVDSLADSIARQLPVLAGISNDLDVSEDAEDLYREAAARTLAELGEGREGNAVATLLRYRDNRVGDVRELLVSMLRKRDQWLRIVSGANRRTDAELDELRFELEAALRRSIEGELFNIRCGFIEALRGDAAELARLSRVPTGEAERKGGVPGASAENLESWRAIAEIALTGDGTIRKVIAGGLDERLDRERCAGLLDSLRSRKEDAELVCSVLKRVRKLPVPQYSDDEWRFVRALLITLLRCAAHLKVVFAEKGTVDFIEMALAARTALETQEGPTELGLAVGSQLKHLLVDEFQDTSQSQLGLINALTKTWEEGSGNSLFLVGDPMQSIYMFREAEVTIFTRAFRADSDSARDLRWRVQPMRLTANFRSQSGLVEWFNHTHSQILTIEDDATAAVSYSTAVAIRDAAPQPVTVKGFSDVDLQGEASFLADEVAACLKDDSELKVAILVRARTHLNQIVRALDERKIGYRAVEIEELAKRQTVMDLDALARAILDEADRTAWLSVLRAPWCGFTLADLWDLCKGDRDSTIPSLLRSRTERLSSQGRARGAKLLSVMAAAARDWTSLPFRLVVERAWISLGGPAGLREHDAHACVREAAAYLSFMEERWANGIRPGTRQFQFQLQRLYAPAATDPSIRVDLLTIHKAKGLEWDVVFLPGLGRGAKTDQKQLLYWREQLYEGSEELLLGPMRSVKIPNPERTIESYLQSIARDRDREELKRLLYVATTRAKKKLYLTGQLTSTGKAKVGSMLALLWPVDELAHEFVDSRADALEEPPALVVPPFRRLPAEFVVPEVPERLAIDRSVATDGEDEPLHTYDWAGETRRRVGTVTHSFLQVMGREGIEQWTPDRVHGARKSIRTALMTSGVSTERIDAAVAEVESALINSLSDERGRWILAGREDAMSEFAITAKVDGWPKRLKIDRTFVEGNVRWVVDFKTTVIEGGDAQRYFSEQVEKYREDLQQYADALRLMEPEREIRVALYFPLQKEFRVVALDESA